MYESILGQQNTLGLSGVTFKTLMKGHFMDILHGVNHHQCLEWILSQLAPLDPQMITTITYEDEMPNFAGVYVYEGDECIDGYEDESDEIMDRIFETHPNLKDKWDEEVEDWKDDDAQDEFQEILWEEISGHQRYFSLQIQWR